MKIEAQTMLALRRIVAALTFAGMTIAAATTAPSDGLPHVYSVVVSPSDVGSFTKVSGLVHTSLDVKVVAVSVGHLRPAHLTQIAPGTFEGTFSLPWLPWFLHGTYVVTFTGYDLRGHSASGTASVNVHW
jgi:hypothetical protein